MLYHRGSFFFPAVSRRRRGSRPHPEGNRSLWDSLYPTLDLHGRTAEEAERDAESWLAQRQLEGEATVRLVTGRGLHSVGPPILPGVIEALLIRLRGSIVEGHHREPGGGAFRVRLRRRADAPLERPDPASRIPPDLERAAAEALAELGITPTPALIAAEVRRITRNRSGDGG